MSGPTGRLVGVELRLLLREPVGAVFTFAFPILTVLVISGSFDDDDPAFGGVRPSEWYLGAYVGVVLAAIGLVMIPTHVAAHRERGVLRRLEASHLPRRALPIAWGAVGAVVAALSIVALVITDEVVYGVPSVERPLALVASLVAGVASSVAVGVALGLLLPSARAAQGVGLALFFPSFLLGGAGPPRSVMPPAMRTVADLLPTTHVVRAVQGSWLSIGDPVGPDLAILAAVTALAASAAVLLTRRRAGA